MAVARTRFYGMGFPARYVQGVGALDELASLLREAFGASAPLLIHDPALSRYLHRFDQPGLKPHNVAFPGNCSEAVIDALTAAGRALPVDCVIGFGGGKTLDAAKAVAADLGKPLIVMPSAASSDAPTSRLVAIYEEHVLKYSRVLARNPDMVLVDTRILAEAPKRLLVAGVGDAISKKFEVAHSIASRVPNTFGMQSLALCRALADECYETVLRHARDAIAQCGTGRPDESFERLVEACVLYSGLSFEGGGLSLAHGLLRGLTRLPQTDDFLHGELVAYGALVQVLACPDQRNEFDRLLELIQSVGLPASLRALNVHDISRDQLEDVAAHTLTAPYLASGVQGISQEDIVEAMLQLERRGA